MKTSSAYARMLAVVAIGMCSAMASPPVMAGAADSATASGACSTTSRAARLACVNEAQDDFWIAMGNCANVPDGDERTQCRSEARAGLAEAGPSCREQYDARQDVCAVLGEAPYAPDYTPSDFVDPLEVGGAVAPNPYLPLVPGTRYTYRNHTSGERIVVSVTHETVEIDGVTCIIVHDVVTDLDSGEAIEDTDDYLVQDLQGNVWYFGEVSREFEDGHLVSLDGSWRAGTDGAKAGILMKAAPQVGEVYRQEFLLGEAEDLARVMNLHGSATAPHATCEGTCLVTREFTPLEPGVLERKFYKPGVGQILGVNAETGAREVLTDVTSF